MKRLAAVFVMVLRVCSQDILPPQCRPTWYAERLGKYPDALEVLADKEPHFSLVYQSQQWQQKPEMQCLRTTNIVLSRTTWSATVSYEYYELDEQEELKIQGTVSASTLHQTNSSISDNTIQFDSGEPLVGTPLAILEVIYNDFHCILTKSDMFGFQVWVRTSDLRTQMEVPYTCTLLYEICSGKPKHFVYKNPKCQNYLSGK
uniref:Putative lipocalin n=1 Tax=Ixodes ricinus TaxID=34613 RepID=A0A6B0V2P9_IXORI